MNVTTRVRRARVARVADCRHKITPGDYYLLHTEFPGGEAGYADYAGHPVQLSECRACAERYDRDYVILARERSDSKKGDD